MTSTRSTSMATRGNAAHLAAFAASIVHEANQPLSGVVVNASTCLRILSADPPDIDGARETARRAARDGRRASDVIVRLCALFTKEQLATEPLDLNELTREVIARSASELYKSQVLLRLELTEDLPMVAGDRVQLQQVIRNLVLNAIEAMSGVPDSPRELTMSTARDRSDEVRLTVRDTGIGLEPQSADRLFDPFYTTKSGGMGIGLSISRLIIERHHGHLWAVANAGPGATFSFSIPQGERRRGPLSGEV